MRNYPAVPNVFRASSATSLLSASASAAYQKGRTGDIHCDRFHTNGDLNNAAHTVAGQNNTATHTHQHHRQHQLHNNDVVSNANGFHGSMNSILSGSGGGANDDAHKGDGLPPKNHQLQSHLLQQLPHHAGPPAPPTPPPPPPPPKSYLYERNSYLLWLVTPVAASFSVAIVIAALAGPQWLLTEEKIPNANYNGTANFNAHDEGIYVTKSTKSSLWILCSTQGTNYHCSKIDYFPNEEYSPDPNDSTMAIPYLCAKFIEILQQKTAIIVTVISHLENHAITRSTPFFFLSAVVLLISYILLMMAMCSQQHSLYYFASGILFIIAGLLMLIGLIMYISIFKAEIGSKLRPKSTLQPPLFTFTYGQSFVLYVMGFALTEFVGMLNVFLFISLQQVGRGQTIPCFVYTGRKEAVAGMGGGSRTDTAKDNDDGFKQFSRTTPNGFSCRKHYPGISPADFCSPFSHRRYFLEKPTPKCGMHAKNLAKSLNELYTEPAPIISPFDYPQEFPLTRSVSTTTDIFTNSEKSRKMSVSRESLNDMCGMKKGILGSGSIKSKQKSKDELFREFCKKAGPRSRPKDIYYIEDDSMGSDDGGVYIVDNSYGRKMQVGKSHPKTLSDLDREYLNNRSGYFDASRNNCIYTSRTLPRDFLKRNHERLAPERVQRSLTLPSGERRVSFTGILRDPHPILQGNDYYQKSFDTLAARNSRHRDAYSSIDPSLGSIQWPAAIPTSPSGFSTRSCHRYNQKYYPRDQEDDVLFDTFDLDKIERDRRKSHASLFDSLDFQGGTPV